MLDVLVYDGFVVASADDEHSIDALPADGPNEAFGECIGTRCSNRSANGPDAFGTEDLVEARSEFGIAVPDQELDRTCTLGELIGQVPGLLDYPGARRIRRRARHEDLPGVQLDEEEDVQPPQEHGIHSEEVAGQHRRGLGL